MPRRFLAFTLLGAAALAPAEGSLKDVLDRMDRAAASFRGVTAKIRKVTRTAVINDESSEQGILYLARRSRREVEMKIDFTEPDPRSIAFSDRKAEIFYPKINTVQVYDLGRHRALVDQFLLLGFGTAGRELTRDYQVRLAGAETVAGSPADKLELIPKAKEAREHLSKVELWIARDGGHPVQQKFYTPSEDTTTILYADILLNPPLGAGELRLKLPPNVKREYPQR